MGPNEGKNYLEQTKCVARALTALGPKGIGDPITFERDIIEYELKHGSLNNKWVKHIHSWGEWYVYRGDPLEEGGNSCQKLPDGVEIAATFDFRSAENVLLKRFEQAISDLEKTIDHVSLIEEINNLKNVLEACRPGYNEKEICKFRNWLKESPDTIPFPDNPNLLIVNPERLISFSRHLAEERSKYCSDAVLLGGVAATVEICNYCASKVSEKTLEKIKIRTPLDVLISLALFLTSDNQTDTQTDPGIILAATVKKAINWGFTEELLEIVIKYREITDEKIEQALNSETTDESFDKLFDAIPYLFAAKVILFNLLNNPDRLGKARSLAKSSYEIVDETLVRLHFAVTNQIVDFFGSDWRRFRAIIARRRKDFGEENAEKYVDYIVEQNLFYPRRFKSTLLDKDES